MVKLRDSDVNKKLAIMSIKKVNHVYTKVIQRLLKNFPKKLNQQVKGIQILKLPAKRKTKKVWGGLGPRWGGFMVGGGD